MTSLQTKERHRTNQGLLKVAFLVFSAIFSTLGHIWTNNRAWFQAIKLPVQSSEIIAVVDGFLPRHCLRPANIMMNQIMKRAWWGASYKLLLSLYQRKITTTCESPSKLSHGLLKIRPTYEQTRKKSLATGTFIQHFKWTIISG